MQPVSISSPKLWDFMFLIDEREASRVRCAGCRHCGGALHSATYARKPRGVPEAVVSGGIASGIAAQFLLRGVSASDDARLRALYGTPAVCGSDRASASGAAWGCEPYGGFGGVPSPWSEPSDATPLAALVAGDICGQRILAGTPGTLPAGCRGVGAPARPAGGVPQRRVAGSSGSGAVVPSGWLHVRGFRGQRLGGPGPAEDVSLMIDEGGRQVPARKSAKRQSAS